MASEDKTGKTRKIDLFDLPVWASVLIMLSLLVVAGLLFWLSAGESIVLGMMGSTFFALSLMSVSLIIVPFIGDSSAADDKKSQDLDADGETTDERPKQA